MNQKKDENKAMAILLVVGLALHPFLSFIAANLRTIDWAVPFLLRDGQPSEIERLVLYACVSVIVWCMAYFVLRFFTKRFAPLQISFALAPAVFLFFFYSSFSEFRTTVFVDVNIRGLTGIIWLSTVVTLGYGLFRASTVSWMRVPTLFGVFTMILMPIGNVLLYGIEGALVEEEQQAQESPKHESYASKLAGQTIPDKNRRNVFWIIPDGYPRSDVLKSSYGIDNSAFLREIEAEGFRVLQQATSNYSTTFFSVQGNVHMDYFADESTSWPNAFAQGAVYEKLFLPSENRVYNFFKSNGYSHVHSGQKIFSCSIVDADACFTYEKSSSELESTLLSRTPLVVMSSWFEFTGHYLSQSMPYPTLSEVMAFIETNSFSKPLFVQAHVLAPHPPFRFRADCTERQPSEYETSLTDWSKKDFFIAHLECANTQLVELVQLIKRKYPDSLIVIQGDHGSDANVNWSLPIEQWSAAAIQEKFSPLSAFYLPNDCADMLYPTMSNVNTFRVILSCLTGKEVNMLNDKSFFISTITGVPAWGEVSEVDPHKGAVVD